MGRRSKFRPPAGSRARARARARSDARRRLVTRAWVVAGAVTAVALLITLMPHGSGGGAPIVDAGATRLDAPTGRPPEATPGPDEPSAQRDLPVRTSASPDPEAQASVPFALDPELRLGGTFVPVPGEAAASRPGRRVAYRVEIEQGLPLDGALFADLVQRTLDDPRSWSRDGLAFARTDGAASFVVRLASPGTLHRICSPIVGDTSRSNVSCNANGTPWVMINGWRWAQGSTAYGDDLLGYRHMLINHEVGHRMGHRHSTGCAAGGLAPVMMQQTKSRVADNGRLCEANPWPYPNAAD
ncbi:hypothetical protein B4N89_31515 [Embleya scabrispora]|uniref:DUF3152 domain-containing protein n=1 Tax=Embleya scabrispora TaxID=159449 RepID=A0A1T3NPQ3_9ACTN|nr:DUF3152 domain-containing protein [Embleya scabrispora]OPC78695.1 hypothetical protein B4N89_31515 [Embleya scabrispora]